jgi:hypothetical protein
VVQVPHIPLLAASAFEGPIFDGIDRMHQRPKMLALASRIFVADATRFANVLIEATWPVVRQVNSSLLSKIPANQSRRRKQLTLVARLECLAVGRLELKVISLNNRTSPPRIMLAGYSMNPYPNPRVSTWLSLIDEARTSQKRPAFQASDFDWLSSAPLGDIQILLEELLQRDDIFEDEWNDHWRVFFDRLARRPAAPRSAERPVGMVNLAKALLEKFSQTSQARNRLLGWLATFDAAALLELVADELVENPPESAQDATLILASLFRARRIYPTDALFPRLLSGLGSPVTSALVLDLGNFLMRHRRVERHPAEKLSKPLQELLSQVLSRLEILEESPAIEPNSPGAQENARARMEQINEGVTLAISLCDALAWTGDQTAIDKLFRASELAHRRLRTEAASALARLGDKRGIDILAELAAEPVVRLRALAYLKELGAEDRADEQYRTREALAESEMVVHLAEPTQFGLPPVECELLEQRTQLWPGYEKPIECFLFHYRYRAGGSAYANVGIVGPLTRSVVADLSDLAPPDIYAFYAGWHAEHEDIREVSAEEAQRAFASDVARLQRKASDAGLQQLEIHKLGLFFGEKVLAAVAQRNGAAGAVVIEDTGVAFYPFAGKRAPIGPDEAYDIFKGRRLLSSFNHP